MTWMCLKEIIYVQIIFHTIGHGLCLRTAYHCALCNGCLLNNVGISVPIPQLLGPQLTSTCPCPTSVSEEQKNAL